MFVDPIENFFHKCFSLLLFYNLGEKHLKELTVSLPTDKFSVKTIEHKLDLVFNSLSNKNELNYKISISDKIDILFELKK